MKTERGYMGADTKLVVVPKYREYDTEKITLSISGKKPVEIKVVDESTATETSNGNHFYIDINPKKGELTENSLVNIRHTKFNWEEK